MVLFSSDGHLMERRPEELAKLAEEAVASASGGPVNTSSIVDTIANILHLVNQSGGDVDLVIRRAKSHFNAEKDAKEE